MIATPSDWARIACELMLASAGLIGHDALARVSQGHVPDGKPAPSRRIRDLRPGAGCVPVQQRATAVFPAPRAQQPGARIASSSARKPRQGAAHHDQRDARRSFPIRSVSSISREYGWDKDHEGMTTTAEKQIQTRQRARCAPPPIMSEPCQGRHFGIFGVRSSVPRISKLRSSAEFPARVQQRDTWYPSTGLSPCPPPVGLRGVGRESPTLHRARKRGKAQPCRR